MRRPRVIVAGYFVRCPIGGYVWQALHYLLGFERLGCDVFFYEDTTVYSDAYDPVAREMNARYDYGLERIAAVLGRFGLGDRWAFRDTWGGRWHGRSAIETEERFAAADLLVNVAGVSRPEMRPGRPPARIYVDIDPAFTQIRLENGDAALAEVVAAHDLHFTVGENVGTPRSPLPGGGVAWRPTRPVVVRDLWESDLAPADAAYTTIGRWDAGERDVEFRGERYGWRKSREWMRFLDLPRRTGERFEVAMDVGKAPADLALLTDAGWEVRDPMAVSIDEDRYRRYIQESKGEFSAAKDMNVRLRSGWFSDRSACYLAAGRPVVVQDTGFGDAVPTGRGLFAVTSLEEAVEAFARIAGDYPAECRSAREIAGEWFSPERVLRPMLEAAGI